MTLPKRRPFRPKNRDGVSRYHRDFIRSLHCSVWKNPLSPCDTDHPTEAAHYRTAANSGAGIKPDDCWLLPLCRAHHGEQHRIGQKAFEERYGISMADIALGLARGSKDQRIIAALAKLA